MAAELSDVIAEGTGPGGEHWVLRAGGSERDFRTFLETIQANGRTDSGGMEGPMLTPGSVMNVYFGTSAQGFLRVVARTDPAVEILRLRTVGKDEPIDLAPVGINSKYPLKFFATLLPGTARITSIEAVGTTGSVLAQRNTERQSMALRKFLKENAARAQPATGGRVVISSEANLENFLELVRLLRRTASDWKPTLSELQQTLTIPGSAIIIIQGDDAIHGFGVIRTSQDPHNATTQISDLIIENRVTGQDAGISMLRQAIQFSAQSGDNAVEVRVSRFDPFVDDVLNRAGFSQDADGVYLHIPG